MVRLHLNLVFCGHAFAGPHILNATEMEDIGGVNNAESSTCRARGGMMNRGICRRAN